MKGLYNCVLMLCLLLPAAFGFPMNKVGTIEEGIPIEIIEKIPCGGLEKGSSFHASIHGHVLTVVFSENLGEVAVDVLTASGSPVQGLSVLTPNGLQVYIPNAGNYIVTFTLPNGDEYYGEFTVTN